MGILFVPNDCCVRIKSGQIQRIQFYPDGMIAPSNTSTLKNFNVPKPCFNVPRKTRCYLYPPHHLWHTHKITETTVQSTTAAPDDTRIFVALPSLGDIFPSIIHKQRAALILVGSLLLHESRESGIPTWHEPPVVASCDQVVHTEPVVESRLT